MHPVTHPTSASVGHQRLRRARPLAVALALAALVTLPAACGNDDPAKAATDAGSSSTHTTHTGQVTPASAASTKPSTTLDVTTGEYRFDVANDRVQAGLVTINLRNEGALPHQVSMVRLHDGVKLDAFLDALHHSEGEAFALADFAAGVNPVGHGAKASVQADLEPGAYTLLCFVPNPDGGNHVDKGMVHQIEVVAPTDGKPAATAPDQVVADVVLTEYSITPPQTGFTAKGTYRFENKGQEPHEVVFLRLKDGKTMADVAAFQAAGGTGEPPFTYEGGPAGMAPGSQTYVDLDLRPGSWLALCMLPAKHTGKPHLEMGMLLPFEIPA